jgi:hypothetical protein
MSYKGYQFHNYISKTSYMKNGSVTYICWSQDSSMHIATALRMDDPGSIPDLVATQLIQWVPGAFPYG